MRVGDRKPLLASGDPGVLLVNLIESEACGSG